MMNLKQLAENLGLSPTTVSRALNDYPEVSEVTRRRVKKAAIQNNYRPNAKAMSLATGRSMVIGHILPLDAKNDIVNPIFSEFIVGASQTYSENGYQLMLSMVPEGTTNQAYRNIASKGSMDGVIVHSPINQDPRVSLLQEIGLPFVLHGRISDEDKNYSWIDVNNKSAFEQATQLLLDLGHQRIAFLNGEEQHHFAQRRRMGFNSAMQSTKTAINPDFQFSEPMTEEYGYRVTKSLLSAPEKDRPSGLLLSSYVIALGARRAIHEAGMQMGKEVSVIIHDDELSYFQNSETVPQFTATRSSVRDAGLQAADMLLKVIKNPDAGPEQRLLECRLTVGSSTGPCIIN